jgi:NAD+ kinase
MKKIFVLAKRDDQPKFVKAKNEIIDSLRQKNCLVTETKHADLILVLGGDGTMLKAIRQHGVKGIPFCGLNFGHKGFLLNEYKRGVLTQIIKDNLEYITAPLLQAKLFNRHGQELGFVYAFNDIYLERSTTNTAKLHITVGQIIRFDPLIADGIIVSSAAGSTSYNASAGGKVVPIGTNSLILTGICPAIFHQWKNCILAADSVITITATELDKRQVRLVADGEEVKTAVKAVISYSDQKVKIAFVTTQNFRSKVLKLQFPE